MITLKNVDCVNNFVSQRIFTLFIKILLRNTAIYITCSRTTEFRVLMMISVKVGILVASGVLWMLSVPYSLDMVMRS